MSNLKFKSEHNKSLLLGVIDDVIRQKFQVTLSDDFTHVLASIMKFVYSRFGKKPKELSAESHLKNINKICLDESIKYVSEHLMYFPKINNTQKNNKAVVIRDPMINKNTPQSTSDSETNPNLFKTTDDLYNQMQFDRNDNCGSMPTQMNFQSPTQPPNQQGGSEQALMLALEQRKKDFPAMNTPNYQSPNNDNLTLPQTGSNDGNNSLLSILLRTSVALQNPSLVPSMVKEIMQMTQLVELMNRDPNSFQQQITNPSFLQMIITQINNKNDPKMRPMNLNENETPSNILAPSQENTSMNSEYDKLASLYKSGVLSTDHTIGQAGQDNMMNVMIPPSDQLINNTLPDLDSVHLIDYDLSLDFRTDLELSVDEKKQYPLRFTKFGNISKIKLSSCMIPENDMFKKEPYIYIKIEELSGRCYLGNRDVVFGKLILTGQQGGYLHYIPDQDSCVQNFSQPISVAKLTVSFLNYNGKYLNLREIQVQKSSRLKKQNKLKFVTTYKHLLNKGEIINIRFDLEQETDVYDVPIDEVVDDQTFTVNNVFDRLSEQIIIMRPSVACSLKFKLFEINWNLLTKKTVQNAQLIKLSQLVSDRRREVLKTTSDDRDLVTYTKSQMNPPNNNHHT
jgi:hypothetical protein